MKILIASSYRPDSETGTSQVSQELCLSLSKNHQVAYLCLGEKLKKIKKNKNLTYLKIPSLKLNNVSIPLITPNIMLDLFNEFEKFAPDIIHAQNSILTSKLTQYWANKNKIPYIVTFHHIPTEPLEHLLPKMSKSNLTKLAQEFYTQTSLKNFLSKTQGVIALNKTIEKSVKKADKSIKIKVINNGLNLKRFKNLKTKVTNKETINFFFLGSYNPRKNQEFLIKTFAFLPKNYILNCFGNKKTGQEYYQKLKNLKTRLKTTNVNLRDYVNNKEIHKIINDQNYLVSASLKEAQSLVVIQALASGKPLLALENETTTEFIDKKVGLIISQRTSPKVFAEEIVEYIKNESYVKMSKQCKLMSNNFDVTKTTKMVEEFYRDIISDS